MKFIMIIPITALALSACVAPQNRWLACPEAPDDCSATTIAGSVSSPSKGLPEAPSPIQTPEAPDAPTTPDMPDTPETPEEPDSPEVPTDPDTPEVPDTPVEPPSHPGGPEGPVGQNPGNGKPVGNAPFDGERGEEPSGKDKKDRK